MLRMLDTDICIYLIKKKSSRILRNLQQFGILEVGISSITLAELTYGVSKSARIERNQEGLQEFLLPLQVASFGRKAANTYGGLRAEMEKTGNLIGQMDLLIAAHALSLKIPLVTHNTREFARVPGLNIEDWTQ